MILNGDGASSSPFLTKNKKVPKACPVQIPCFRRCSLAPVSYTHLDNDNTHATKYIKRVTDPENLKASNELLEMCIRDRYHYSVQKC